MTLDKKVGTRLKRTMNAIPRNLDGILKSDKEGILKIVSLKCCGPMFILHELLEQEHRIGDGLWCWGNRRWSKRREGRFTW